MKKYQATEKALLFIGSLFSDIEIFDSLSPLLTEKFGNIIYRSPSLPWNFTSYYSKELGPTIYRNFVFFNNIIDPIFLIDAKLITNEIEITFSKNNNRQINLDPGYITLAKVVLASTKNYSHRLYLGKGIYGEMTLMFTNGRFNPLFYTYNDYKDEVFLNIFNEARGLLKNPIP